MTTFLGTLIAVPILLTRMRADYFVGEAPPRDGWRGRHPIVRILGLFAKNLLGAAMLLNPLNQDYNTQGFGPEMLIVPLPSESEQIAIGVHVFQAASAQPVTPRIQIMAGGPTVLDVELDLTTNQFWFAAETLGTNLAASYTIVTDGFPGPDVP